MDRRTKIILLIIGSVILLALVIWFFVWPLLQPVLPTFSKPQPPAIGEPQPPSTEIPNTTTPGGANGLNQDPLTVSPGSDNPDVQRIIELSRRAGVLSERAESGSSQGMFNNYADAALDASPELAKKFLAQQAELRKAHPETGPNYLTLARRLVEIPESRDTINGDTFLVRVQLQVQVTDNGKTSIEYREAAVRFDRRGGDWVIASYETKPFTP